MKLKCKRHNRRVMVLPSGTTVHREDGSRCRAQTLKIGASQITPKDVLSWQPHEATGDRAAALLLEEIFGAQKA
jgi:hypothetical protein